MRDAEIREAGDAMLGDPAGNDAGVMGEVGRHVEADAMQADPALQA